MSIIKEENPQDALMDEERELYDKTNTKALSRDKNTIRQFIDKLPIGEIEFLHDISLQLIARFGTTTITIRELMSLKEGSVTTFEKIVGEPVDVVVGNKIMARGEIVIVNDRYGVRISEITRPD